MATTLGRFLKHLSDSGVLSLDEIQALQGKVPASKGNEDAKQFALDLVKQKKLTLFQADCIYNGKLQGLTLDDYVILEKIGAGGMGMVFKAEHRRMKRLVAIKLLSDVAMKAPENVRRFHREVEAAAKLTHPNIVAAHDAREWNGRHYLVMEFVDGTDLSRLVEKKGVLSIDQAIDYILQAAKGLEHAHKTGLVHRDIKPANLLLDKSGTIKILDMGLARLQAAARGPFSEPPKDDSELTQAGSIMGTVDFMSPEQALDSRHADATADIYSLGCTLYFLLIGRPLYQGETVLSRLVAHREMPAPSLRAARKEVPSQIDAIYSKMVAKNTADRYQTMTDVIRDLSDWRKVASKPSAAEAALLGDEMPPNVINAIFDDD